RRRRDPVLLERAGRVPARLRPRRHRLRRPGDGRACGCRRRRGVAPVRDARPRRRGAGRVSTTTADARPETRSYDWRRLARRHGWTLGLFVLLVLMVLYWRSTTIRPWGTFDVQSLCIDALPLAFAAMGQAIVIIAGGIDLSIGSLMGLVNVLAAKYMVTDLTTATPRSFQHAIVVSILLIAFGFLAGALTGLIIHLTKVADIIVTLAMLFVWGGAALAVLQVPGGGAPPQFYSLVTTDTVVTKWLPKPLFILFIAYALIWVTIRRRRPGLALYAIGSNRPRAYLSGINVPLTRIMSYALSGTFAALGGRALTA